MAGNRRGRLKEHFEGIHKNFDWVLYHVNKSLELLANDKPDLSKSIDSLGKTVQAIDRLAKDVYDRL